MISGHTNPAVLPTDVANDEGFELTDLEEGLHQAFIVSNYILATFQESTIAIHGNLDSQCFYLFDSHQRNRNGNHSSNGAAVLMSSS